MPDATPFDRIEELRTERNIAMRELCRQAGLAENLLAMAKKSRRLEIDSIAAFAKALDVPMAQLLGEEARPSEPPSAPGARGLADIPAYRLHPSPLNPRKRFDPEALAELSTSINAEGVLENLLVRPHPKITDAFEIIAGERRYRAFMLLVDADTRSAADTLPCRIVDPCDDRKLLELAVSENVARSDMTPLEEAEAFQQLIANGAHKDEIAELVGKSKRFVELRLKLVTGLCPEAVAALKDGTITVEQARALTVAPLDKQRQHLSSVIRGDWNYSTAEQIREQIKCQGVPVGRNLFGLDEYDGPFLEDEDSGEKLFADVAQFSRLQDAAIAAKAAELQTKFAWVKVYRRGEGGYFHEWEYETRKKDPAAGAIIEEKYNLQVQIHTGLVLKPEYDRANSKAPGKTQTDPEPVTKSHLAHARRRKTAALQAAVAADPTTAMRLACLALLGGDSCVRIRSADLEADDDIQAAPVVDGLKDHAKALQIVGKLKISRSGVRLGDYSTVEKDEVALWPRLLQLGTEELSSLFAHLVALRVGSFNGYATEAGDRPTAVLLAHSLGIATHEEQHGLTLQEQDLDGLRKDALLTVAKQAEVDGQVNDMTAKALKGYILGMADKDYVLPTLRFGTRAEIEAALKGRKPYAKPTLTRTEPPPQAAEKTEIVDLAVEPSVADRVREILRSVLDVPGEELPDDTDLFLSEDQASRLDKAVCDAFGTTPCDVEFWTNMLTVGDVIIEVGFLIEEEAGAKRAGVSR